MRLLLLAALLLGPWPLALAQGAPPGGPPHAAQVYLTLLTQHGRQPANADRVLAADDGRWREVEGRDGRYEVAVTGGSYEVAIVCAGAAGFGVTLYRFPLAELPLVRHACDGRSDLLAPRHRLQGEVIADEVPTGGPLARRFQQVDVMYGSLPIVSGPANGPTPFEVSLPAGSGRDLLALRRWLDQPPDKAVLIRDFQLREDSSVTVDLLAPSALELPAFVLSVDGQQDVILTARLITCNGTYGNLEAAVTPDERATRYAALPHAARRDCDRYHRRAVAVGGADGYELRAALAFDSEPSDTALSLPPLVEAPRLERLGGEEPRARFSWSADPHAVLYTGALTDGDVVWTFFQSAALPTAVTVPAWEPGPGADGAGPPHDSAPLFGVPVPSGAALQWGFGVLRSNGATPAALHAWEQSHWFGAGRFAEPVDDGLTLAVSFVDGEWAPADGEQPGVPPVP